MKTEETITDRAVDPDILVYTVGDDPVLDRELTVWDCGTQDPSLEVAAGSTDVAFDLANQRFSGRGRGRLIVRELCDGIERNSYPPLNETTYHIPFSKEA